MYVCMYLSVCQEAFMESGARGAMAPTFQKYCTHFGHIYVHEIQNRPKYAIWKSTNAKFLVREPTKYHFELAPRRLEVIAGDNIGHQTFWARV